MKLRKRKVELQETSKKVDAKTKQKRQKPTLKKKKKSSTKVNSDDDYVPEQCSSNQECSRTNLDISEEQEVYGGVLRSDKDKFPNFPPENVWTKILGYIIDMEEQRWSDSNRPYRMSVQKRRQKLPIPIDENEPYLSDSDTDSDISDYRSPCYRTLTPCPFDIQKEDWPVHWTEMDKVLNHTDVIYSGIEVSLTKWFATEYKDMSEEAKLSTIKDISVVGTIKIDDDFWIHELVGMADTVGAHNIKLEIKPSFAVKSLTLFIEMTHSKNWEISFCPFEDQKKRKFKLQKIWKFISLILESQQLEKLSLNLNQPIEPAHDLTNVLSEVRCLKIDYYYGYGDKPTYNFPWNVIQFKNLDKLILDCRWGDFDTLVRSHFAIQAKQVFVNFQDYEYTANSSISSFQRTLTTMRETRPTGDIVVVLPDNSYLLKPHGDTEVKLEVSSNYIVGSERCKYNVMARNRRIFNPANIRDMVFDLDVFHGLSDEQFLEDFNEGLSFELSEAHEVANSLNIYLALPMLKIKVPSGCRSRPDFFDYTDVPNKYIKLVADSIRQEFAAALRGVKTLEKIYVFSNSGFKGPIKVDENIHAELINAGYPFIEKSYDLVYHL